MTRLLRRSNAPLRAVTQQTSLNEVDMTAECLRRMLPSIKPEGRFCTLINDRQRMVEAVFNLDSFVALGMRVRASTYSRLLAGVCDVVGVLPMREIIVA